MKKEYESPIIEIIELNEKDIIIMSSFGNNDPGLEDDDNLLS